jgi:hypothetical protein
MMPQNDHGENCYTVRIQLIYSIMDILVRALPNVIIIHILRYLRALAQEDRIAFSMPYEDAFGAGAVITMGKALFASRYNSFNLLGYLYSLVGS